MPSLRLIFMGSPDIAVPSLKALHQAGHEIVCVVTQPDKPSGRGQKVQSPAVKVAAQGLGLKVLQPAKIKDPAFWEQLTSMAADAIVVVAYGKILSKEILEMTRLGCVNVHFSLLPKFRGASCVAYALLQGESETGVSTMLIDEALDSGPILMQRREPIGPDDTTEVLSGRLAQVGAQLIVETLEGLEAGTLKARPQNDAEASYAPRLKKEEGRVDWTQPAGEIYGRFRGLTPWPGLYTFLGDKRILLSEVRLDGAQATGDPGTLEIGPQLELYVNCGEGKLRLLRLKPEGKRVLSAEEFVRGLQSKENLVFK